VQSSVHAPPVAVSCDLRARSFTIEYCPVLVHPLNPSKPSGRSFIWASHSPRLRR
jgi:hypothetical protein